MKRHIIHNNKIGYELNEFIRSTGQVELVYRKDLHFGDIVLVHTLNSVYYLQYWGNNYFGVTGGWFDRHGYSVVKLGINGCTWGGSMLKHDAVAGKGFCLEFSNCVRTSWIVDVSVYRPMSLN